MDITPISQKLKTYQTPTLNFIRTTIEISGVDVGVIHIETHALCTVV